MNHHAHHNHNHVEHKRQRGGYYDAKEDGVRNSGGKYDDPPNSRLFIVCGKQITEEQFKEAFGKFGTIEEVWVLKDRVTGEPKGITYIKFSKTSEAALAMEVMNGQCVEGSPRPLKVLIAHSRDQGSRRDMNEEERLLRLFVMVNKTMTEADLKEHFAKFGDIDYVSIVRDRNTKESKGFAYVKYHRMSHAAKAFEECDRSFKPVFADPKPQKYDSASAASTPQTAAASNNNAGPGSTASGSTSASMSASYDALAYMDTSGANPEGVCRLHVSTSPSVNQDQVWRLFDLVPGLDYCERKRNSANSNAKGIYTAVYNNPQSATYAKEKLHGFEYPPGCRIVVRFEDNNGGQHQMYNRSNKSQQNNSRPNFQNDLAHLTETIANATALLQAAGYNANAAETPKVTPTAVTAPVATPSSSADGSTYDPSYCSVKLPAPQPLAAMDSEVAERLFVVCTPVPPQLYTLKDVFGRFGNLIDIYMLNGKTCGYAKYASKESAQLAVAALHGQEMTAEPQQQQPQQQDKADSSRKRPKIESNE